MNRIILIGNGFDLAHGLKTSYNDFILDIWQNITKSILQVKNSRDNNDTPIFTLTYGDSTSTNMYPFDYCLKNLEINEKSTYQEVCDKFKSWNIRKEKSKEPEYFVNLKIKNKFLEELLQKREMQNWVDIEAEYYRQLKENATIQDEESRIKNIKILNKELDQVKDLLDKYLQKVTQPDDNLFLNNLEGEIYSPFKESDFEDAGTIKGSIEPIYSCAAGYLKNTDKKIVEDLAEACIPKYRIQTIMDRHFYYNQSNWQNLVNKSLNELINPISDKDDILEHFAIPMDILLLNFNYTSTSDLYAKLITTNHIHGELNQKESSNLNPMIFGYGDELSEDYKKLENLNENDVLENVKSIRYLETNNYRRLLSFIESDQYQIYVMGHSCGISDRTLLNTLFEHKNCVSIKPFYYEWEEDGIKKDNYRELIQNISRNFNDKRVMRSKVVNKLYCKPLPQR